MSRDIAWTRLKPGARYNATHGAFVAGLTLLQIEGGIGPTVVICGAMSCGGATIEEARANAEAHAERYRGRLSDPLVRGDLDHPVWRKEFLTMVEDPA